VIILPDRVIACPPRCGTMSARAHYRHNAILLPFEHYMAWPKDGKKRTMLIRDPIERFLSSYRYIRQRRGYAELQCESLEEYIWKFFRTSKYAYWTANLTEWRRMFKPTECLQIADLTGKHLNRTDPIEGIDVPDDPRLMSWVNEDRETFVGELQCES